MGPIEFLRGRVVGLDTAPLIYYVEQNPKYFELVRPLFEAAIVGEIQVVTLRDNLIRGLGFSNSSK